MANHKQRKAEIAELAKLERGRHVVRVPMGKVSKAVAYQPGLAISRDFGDPHRDLGDRSVGGEA